MLHYLEDYLSLCEFLIFYNSEYKFLPNLFIQNKEDVEAGDDYDTNPISENDVLDENEDDAAEITKKQDVRYIICFSLFSFFYMI